MSIKALSSLKETAAPGVGLKEIFAFLDIPIGKPVKVGTLWAIPLKSRRTFANYVDTAKLIGAQVDPGYFGFYASKKTETIWVDAPFTPRSTIQFEFLLGWKLVLCSIDTGMAGGPYFKDAVTHGGYQGPEKE